MKPRLWLDLGRMAALAAIYFAAARFGLSFATIQENVTLVWPPTGIALAALLLFGVRLWPGVALGAFLANVTTEISPIAALGIAIGNTLEALVGAYLLQRAVGFRNSLERLQDVFGLILLAAGLSTMVSATIGVTSLCVSGAAPWTAFRIIWSVWWLGDLMGALLVAPVLLAWGTQPRIQMSLRVATEAGALLLALVGISLSVFGGQLAYPYFFFPLVLWGALRFGARGAATTTLLVAGFAVWSMTQGWGPFIGQTLEESLVLFNTFTGVMSVLGLLLAAIIAERQHAEAALRASEGQYRTLAGAAERQAQELALLDRVRTALSRELDLSTVFRTVVEAITQTFGYTLVSIYLLEEDALVLQHQKGYDQVIERIPITQGISGQVISTGQPILLEDVRTDPAFLGAIEGIVSEVCVPLFDEGRVAGMLNIESTQGVPLAQRDLELMVALSEHVSIAIGRARLYTEVHALNAELERRVIERTAQLEAAVREIENFSYTVSHDLRAPLRAVHGFAAILQDEYGAQFSSETLNYLQRIRENGLLMGQLVDSLLDFIRLSRRPLMKEMVFPTELVHQALAELRAGIENRRVDITIGELPPCQADPELLKRVWVNLLSNALKFTRQQETARIEVGSRTEADQPVYFVRDNGVGFEMQYAHKLFGVFQRLHLIEEYEGIGVGLALAQRIIHRHGGRIWAESEVERGAVFYFVLGE